MIDFAENIKLSFGAKYVVEDTASYILYKFDRSSLDGRAVSMERFARFLGLDVKCEYITGDCTDTLGIIAYEPQRVFLYAPDSDYGSCGSSAPERKYIDLPTPAAIAERDLIDRGESGLYNFTLALLCSEYLYYQVKNGGDDSMQLSFGFESVTSERNKRVTLEEAFCGIEKEEGAASFALKLLLPKNGFKRRTVALYSSLGVNRATVDGEKHLPTVLSTLAENYNAPEAAIAARLVELNLY